MPGEGRVTHFYFSNNISQIVQLLGRIADSQYYTVFQKNWTTKLMAVTLSNLNRFSKFFHC